MPYLIVVDSSNNSQQVEFQSGLTLMEVLSDQAFAEVKALCGGCCSCGTCHVHIDQDNTVQLDEAEEDELSMLEFQDRYDINQSRLSCQIQLNDSHDGLRVQLIENQA